MLYLFISQDLLAGAFQSLSAEFEDDGMVGNLQRLPCILFHHNEGAPFRVDLLNGFKDLGHHQGGKAKGRLIKEDDLGIQQESGLQIRHRSIIRSDCAPNGVC